MKKALALVLALVLALSMAVSAFALQVVVLTPAEKTGNGEIDINLVDAVADGYVLYASKDGTYYIALDEAAYKDIKLTTNGCLSAELVNYDPAKMNVYGVGVVFSVVYNNEVVAVYGSNTEAAEDGDYTESTDAYAAALADAEARNDADKVNLYSVAVPNVNIIKVTVAKNYSAHYEVGTLKIEAVLDKTPVSAVLEIVNDVTIWEYEQVKWAAEHFDDVNGKALLCGVDGGYSDYITDMYGYDRNENDSYEWSELRDQKDAAVVSTTAFRAIAGKDLRVACDDVVVELYDIAAGQKGVNFKHYNKGICDTDGDKVVDAYSFGFYGDQVISGDYCVSVDTGYNWYTLREAFGVKVEEDDIISYYVLKNGKVVAEYVVDYMTADIYEDVVVDVDGSNSALGEYKIVLEVPAVEGGEENPNTGAESVVGVVAALAVVSLATAAAVSLKK